MSSVTALPDPRARVPELQFVLKVASRCNLACTYCYVYAKGDTSWRGKPAIMPEHVLEAAVRRIVHHCRQSRQRSVRVTFHGGEPTAVGTERFDRWCRLLRTSLQDVCDVELSMQTNGVLLDEDWCALLAEHAVSIGLSIDGPREVHDRARVDHAGRGSHGQVVRGLGRLLDASVAVQLLCVVQPGESGAYIHEHLSSLGAGGINYLFPDHTHDTVGAVRALHGRTPCADYLLPILDEWWLRGDVNTRITPLWNIARLVMGGGSQIDVLGHAPYQYVFVEADGSIEGLDVLRICGGDGLSGTGLSVLHHDFSEIAERSELHRAVMFDGVPTPGACHGCHEEHTCAGGYLPHRYSAGSLDHRSVWCPDILLLFARMRELLGVPVDETRARRQALDWLSAGGLTHV